MREIKARCRGSMLGVGEVVFAFVGVVLLLLSRFGLWLDADDDCVESVDGVTDVAGVSMCGLAVLIFGSIAAGASLLRGVDFVESSGHLIAKFKQSGGGVMGICGLKGREVPVKGSEVAAILSPTSGQDRVVRKDVSRSRCCVYSWVLLCTGTCACVQASSVRKPKNMGGDMFVLFESVRL